jgi:hypothetical protein
MTIASSTPIIVRLYEPITLLFPEAGDMPPLATVLSPCCVLCGETASPPSRMGWLETPERQALFVVCGSCSDCSDAELERRIINLATAQAADEVRAAKTWATRAAMAWADSTLG